MLLETIIEAVERELDTAKEGGAANSLQARM